MTIEAFITESSLDIKALSAYLQKVEEEKAQLQEENAKLKEDVSRLNQELGQVLSYLKQMKQTVYGFSSEKMATLPLFASHFPEQQKQQQAEEKKTNVVSIAAHQRAKPGRRPLPENLQREEIIHDLTDDEKVCHCGKMMTKIGEERTEQLGHIPARYFARVHVRCKYACRHCEEGVTLAPLPAQPIPQSIATPELLAHILVSKCEDHLPLYRQEKMMERVGVDISRGTLAQWMIKCAKLLEPIDALMRKTIKACDYLQVDETTLQVLKEPGRSPHTLSYMWLYRTAALVHPCIVFDYQPTRGQEAPTLFLKDFKGHLQTDAYNGYDYLKAKTTIIGMGCWAHVRRKFAEIVKMIKDYGQAAYALEIIAKLYAIEARARQEELPPPAIYALRQKEALPLLETFKTWLDDYVLRTAPKTLLGKAIRYALNQWDTLTVYCTDGRLNIDNNLIENAIRPFAVGRKNWLFADTVEGAKASAILYGIFATCKANNVHPYDYLCKALTLLPAYSPNDDFTPLLPYNLLTVPEVMLAKAA